MTSVRQRAVPTHRRVSEEEYLALPEVKPYLEFLDGAIVPKAMPNEDHTRLAHELDGQLWLYRREHGGTAGPEPRVRFETVDGGVFHRLPDVAYWAPGRPVSPGRGEAMLPPTLAIEVRSPDESLDDQRAKCRFFRENGVDVCWLFDPVSRTIEVFEADEIEVLGPGDTLRSSHLPAFAMDVAALFAQLD